MMTQKFLGTWPTRRTFNDIICDLVFVVPRIDSRWFKCARWLQRKDSSIVRVSLHDWFTLSEGGEYFIGVAVVLMDFIRRINPGVRRRSRDQIETELYNIPLFITKSKDLLKNEPLVTVEGPDFIGYICDAADEDIFASTLLNATRMKTVFNSRRGCFRFDYLGEKNMSLCTDVEITRRQDATNTIIAVNSSEIIKVYRRLNKGLSPDIEMNRVLNSTGFPNIPNPLGYAVYSEDQGSVYPVFFIQEYLKNEGDVWSLLYKDASEFFKKKWSSISAGKMAYTDLADCTAYGSRRRENYLGVVTAGLHRASSNVGRKDFLPEPMEFCDVKGLIHNIALAISITTEELERVDLCKELSEQKEIAFKSLRKIKEVFKSSGELGMKIRIHGDLHLGQFLQVKRNDVYDFMIIDFEGEPLRPLHERIQKSSPLRDVAGMLRSFNYLGYSAAFNADNSPIKDESFVIAVKEWIKQAGEGFLGGYLKEINKSDRHLIPPDTYILRLLLLCFKLEKALYEVRYELRTRPRWINIALRGALDSINEIQLNSSCKK
ncbi:MAG: hypothetical protein GX969_00055 [Firmicutes bacterium]|nr:hypothetical protein [Bacillota bacterium]